MVIRLLRSERIHKVERKRQHGDRDTMRVDLSFVILGIRDVRSREM